MGPCGIHGRGSAPVPKADIPIGANAGVRMVEIAEIVVAHPFLSYRRLPTLHRARILLQGDHGLDRAEARIDNVVVAPVLHNSVGVLHDRGISRLIDIRGFNRSRIVPAQRHWRVQLAALLPAQ